MIFVGVCLIFQAVVIDIYVWNWKPISSTTNADVIPHTIQPFTYSSTTTKPPYMWWLSYNCAVIHWIEIRGYGKFFEVKLGPYYMEVFSLSWHFSRNRDEYIILQYWVTSLVWLTRHKSFHYKFQALAGNINHYMGEILKNEGG